MRSVGRKESKPVREAYQKEIKDLEDDSPRDRDLAPRGILRGARTTLDAVRAKTHAIQGCTTFTGFAQLGGIAATQLHDEEFELGASMELVYASPISDKPNAPKAVKVWFFLKDSEREDVRQEYVNCDSSGKSLNLCLSDMDRSLTERV